ncbi:MAG: hypothetical protein E6G79_14220 [Alphaproteobacteria bacterium]|nr:MAG: hypothetical protein E6G79_14220 [Alphaproteobacteria bacterium]
MTIADAYRLLLEAAALAASFAMLWLSFWLRDRHRQYPVADFARDQQDGANIGPLVVASVGAGSRLPINVASSDVQPASEKDEAVLYCPENVQYLNDEPQIQAEQTQCAQLKPMKPDPVFH